jgi:outer membrane protein assembly factor BamE (lipoprotein component of BamABCDE complex)
VRRVDETGMKLCIAASLVLMTTLGCATRGSHFDVDSVDRITPGATTQEEVRRWFGEPGLVRRHASGRTSWGYEFQETQTRSTSSVSKVLRFVAAILGWRYFFPPVDVTYEKSTRHSLSVLFKDGVVVDFTYERETTPSKRIH